MDKPRNNASNKDKRRLSATFVNMPNKCMTKSLAREKYKQSVSTDLKNNGMQNDNSKHNHDKITPEIQSEVESQHFLDEIETIIDLK